jgi:hypothetical protein
LENKVPHRGTVKRKITLQQRMQQMKAKEVAAASDTASAAAAQGTPEEAVALAGVERTIYATEAELDATVASLEAEMDPNAPPAKRPHHEPTA